MKEWSYFDRFDEVNDKYLPVRGEGENKATQIVTAVCKLVYKWYNDGDVFDNTYDLKGWCNDLTSYANWLDKYTNAGRILDNIALVHTDGDYEDLLADLADTLLDKAYLEEMARQPKVGTIYDCDGPFEYTTEYEEDEEEWWR